LDILLFSLVFSSAIAANEPASVQLQRVESIPITHPNAHYISNREPLIVSQLVKLPPGSIVPRGWLRHMLELEAGGMTGRLAELSPWLNFERSAWASKEGKGEAGWEEMPYWLKGYGDLGYVLKDDAIIKKARKWIEAAMASQVEDGWFGPRELRASLGKFPGAEFASLAGKPDLWPHMIMLNVLQSYHEFSGDPRVLNVMSRYFAWQAKLPDEAFGAGYWPKIRMGDNLESIYWLYNRTGDKSLLALAERVHKNMADWTSEVPNLHNVNVSQGFREPAIYFMQSKDPKHLNAVERNYQKIKVLYGQFPGGGFAGDENCRPGYTDPRQGFETCGIVEFMHSFEMLTAITGNPIWADRCEDVAFNSFPAAMTADLKGLRYLTCPNLIQADKQNHKPGFDNSGTQLSYSPHKIYRCCQHNVSHGWPYFAENLWLATADNGLCASLFSASEVTAKVGDGTEVKIALDTDYPFDDRLTFKVSCPRAVRFPLYVRVPAWSDTPELHYADGKAVSVESGLPYLKFERTWASGDTVCVRFPMAPLARVWEQNKHAVSVSHGPLSFSLKIGERWVRYGGTEDWPEWEVYPTTAWNYGLVLDQNDSTNSFEVVRKSGPIAKQPFLADSTPIELRVKAKKILAWKQDRTGLVGALEASPVRSDEPTESITLIPMGAARLRISMFPTIGNGTDAHEWGESAKAK
jgi:hypothetical protein